MPDAYEGISGITDIAAPQRLKLAIVGEPKTGKSWFALTHPSKIFHLDFDDRKESVKEFINTYKKENITTKTYVDTDPANPKAAQNLETDLNMFDYLAKQGKAPETYILDSMTFLRSILERELIRQQPSLSRPIKLGTQTLKIGQGWDIVNGVKAYMEYIVGRLSANGNVIAVFHELDEKDTARSTKEEKVFTGRKTIQPQYLATLLSTFNDVFRISIDYAGNRVVECKATSNFMASTSMKLDATEQPDLAKMIEKHKKASGL